VSENREEALAARGLTKRFGAFTAVDRLDLTVRAGEVFGLLGSNGAGKSTAIRMFCGLLKPSSGAASVLGVDVAHDPERVKRSLGYMSQRFSLYPSLTVHQNLRFFGGVYGLRGKALRSAEARAIAAAGLAGLEGTPAASLAGGFRQRLALACAVLHEPRILFLDEPTGGVDPLSRRTFWGLIDALAASGVTVIVTTHHLDEAEHCARAALMHAGRIVAEGTLEQLRGVFGARTVLEVVCKQALEAFPRLAADPAVLESAVFGARLHLVVADAASAKARLARLLEAGGNVPYEIEEVLPSLEDVFIHAIASTESRGSAT